MRKILTFELDELEPYINWLYFYHAWGLSGKPQEAKAQMRNEAEQMLREFTGKYRTHAVFVLLDANSDGDDIIIGNTRLPMLRQQKPASEGSPNL